MFWGPFINIISIIEGLVDELSFHKHLQIGLTSTLWVKHNIDQY